MIFAQARTARMLYHLALADFRERTRRYSFLILLGGVAYLGYTVNTGEFSLKLGQYQGITNSAWVGAQMTLVLTFVIGLFGFFLVRNSVERDTRTGVGQIIATTPLSRPAYLFGKWLSHFMLLGVMILLLAAAALLMQLLRHEAPVDAWALLAPFLFVALPSMALIAGIAVFFEAVPFLRGGLGGLVYFFAWLTLMGMTIDAFTAANQAGVLFTDPFGMGTLIPPMQAVLRAGHSDYTGGFSLSVSPGRVLQPFQYDGMAWTLAVILRQSVWTVFGIGLVLLGSPFFERFDPARLRPLSGKPKPKAGRDEDPIALPAAEPVSTALPRPAARLLPLAQGTRARWQFPAVFLAELRLLLKGWPWWWYAAAGGLILACLFSPLEVVRDGLLPAAWVWPVLIWSGMGCREERFMTRQIIYSAPRPVWQQIPAAWLAGAAVTAAAGSGAAVVYGLAGDASALLGWLAGVLFIPSLALASGAWSGSNRLFEILYLVLWYLGPVQHFKTLDFATQPVYILAAAALFVAAFIGRSLRMQR